jgi:hypothetical protein
MNTIRDICQHIGKIIRDAPSCIETGTMYVCLPGNEIHTTTNNIMEFIVAPKNGTLWSLDIDQEHIDFSKSFCKKYSGALLHLLGDSVEMMERLASNLLTFGNKVDLLCLDGKEFDEDHMVNEFNAIKDRLAEKHFVLVDDIHNQNSVKYKKMVPILKELDYSYLEVPTPTGMFVAWKGYNF